MEHNVGFATCTDDTLPSTEKLHLPQTEGSMKRLRVSRKPLYFALKTVMINENILALDAVTWLKEIALECRIAPRNLKAQTKIYRLNIANERP